LIIIQRLDAVSHTACARVGGSKNFGTRGPAHWGVGMGRGWPPEICFFPPVLRCQIRSY